MVDNNRIEKHLSASQPASQPARSSLVDRLTHLAREFKENYVDASLENLAATAAFQKYERIVGGGAKAALSGVRDAVFGISNSFAELAWHTAGYGNFNEYLEKMREGLVFAYEATFVNGAENIRRRLHQMRKDSYQAYLDSMEALGSSVVQTVAMAPAVGPTINAVKGFAADTVALGRAIGKTAENILPPPTAMTTAGVMMPVPSAIESGAVAVAGGSSPSFGGPLGIAGASLMGTPRVRFIPSQFDETIRAIRRLDEILELEDGMLPIGGSSGEEELVQLIDALKGKWRRWSTWQGEWELFRPQGMPEMREVLQAMQRLEKAWDKTLEVYPDYRVHPRIADGIGEIVPLKALEPPRPIPDNLEMIERKMR